MRRDLMRRLKLVEQRMAPRQYLPRFVVILNSNGVKAAEGERIVADWISDDGGFVVAEARVTSDPNDHGTRCPCTPAPWTRGLFGP